MNATVLFREVKFWFYYILKEVKIKNKNNRKNSKIISFLYFYMMKKITGKEEPDNNRNFSFRKQHVDGIFA